MRLPGEDLGLLQMPVAQRDGRAVVIGHVEDEWLSRLLRGLPQCSQLASCGLEIAQSDEGRHSPGYRLGADLGVAELGTEIPGFGQHGEDLVERTCPA